MGLAFATRDAARLDELDVGADAEFALQFVVDALAQPLQHAGDIGEDGILDLDDVMCADGQYDIKLDAADYKVVEQRKE